MGDFFKVLGPGCLCFCPSWVPGMVARGNQWGPRYLCHCPCLSSWCCLQRLSLDLHSACLLSWNFRFDDFVGWLLQGPGLLGVGFIKHSNVNIHPQLCNIYMKRIKTKVTAMINVHTLGSYQAFWKNWSLDQFQKG